MNLPHLLTTRDGLAVRAAAEELLNREEEKKILILLSDGKPYDVVVNQARDAPKSQTL